MDFVLMVIGIGGLLLTLRAIAVCFLTPEEREELEATQCPRCRTGLLTFLIMSHLIKGTCTIAKRIAKRNAHDVAEAAKQVKVSLTKTSQATLTSVTSTNKKLKPSV